MSQHTPGPYRAAKQDYQWYVQSQHVRHPNGSGNWADVATVSYVNGCGEPEARLFAAAPDLLEALQSILDMCNEDSHARDYASRQTEIRGTAIVALRKARGEQT